MFVGLLPQLKNHDANNNIQSDVIVPKTDPKTATKTEDSKDIEIASDAKATKKTNSKTKTGKVKSNTVKEELVKPSSEDKKEDKAVKITEDKIEESKKTKSKETKQTTKKKATNSEKDTDDKTEKPKDVVPKKELPKRKEKPPPAPHEWIFPEMESVLSQLFENLKNKVGTQTNKYFGASSKTKPKSEEKVKPADKADLDFEESDADLPKEAVEQVLIRLSNGDVYESPRYLILLSLSALYFKNKFGISKASLNKILLRPKHLKNQ